LPIELLLIDHIERPSVKLRAGEQNGIPFFAKKGWLRHKENGPVPYSAQTG
jgi:hypothetical protein